MGLNDFVLYLNAVNVIKDGAFMNEENNKQIAVAKETCEMAFKFWKHYDDLSTLNKYPQPRTIYGLP